MHTISILKTICTENTMRKTFAKQVEMATERVQNYQVMFLAGYTYL